LNLYNYLDTSVTSDELYNALYLTKNSKRPGEDIINLELFKYTSEYFKLRLLLYLNNMYKINCILNEWGIAIVIQIFKKGDRRDPKIAAELVFLTPPVSYTLQSLLLNCRVTQNSLRQKR
jgi:hypothetical protein